MTATQDVREIVAANLKALREKSPLSASELAEQSGVDRTYWYLLEKGQVNFTIDKLSRIAEVLGVSVRDLLSEEDVTVLAQSEKPSKPKRRKAS